MDAAWLLALMYGAPAAARGGQVHVLAALSAAQRAGHARNPSRLLNAGRDLLTRGTGSSLQRHAADVSGAEDLPLVLGTGRVRLTTAIKRRWGTGMFDPAQTLAALRRAAALDLSPPRLARWLLREEDDPVRLSWHHAQAYGLSAATYLEELLTLRRLLASRRRQADKVAELDERLIGLVEGDGIARLAALPRDRGLMICGTHAGAFRFGHHLLRRAYPDLVTLGVGDGEDGAPTVADPVRALFTMVKHLRAPGAVALIGADGPRGDSTAPVRIRDLDVPVRLGAPTVIYNARCASVFFVARWTETGVALDLREGPAVDPGIPFARWCERWLESYAAVMNDLVDGNAADIQGGWGMWALIRGALSVRERAGQAR